MYTVTPELVIKFALTIDTDHMCSVLFSMLRIWSLSVRENMPSIIAFS